MVNLDQPTKAIFHCVPNRSANVLLPVIQYHVPRQSTIVSDEWAAYRRLQQIGYLHLTVNHSRYFVDPRTGTYSISLYIYFQNFNANLGSHISKGQDRYLTCVLSILGAHTNHIECCWSHVKRFMADKRPRNDEELQDYLYIYMWRNWLARDYLGGPFMRLVYDISQYFPMH